MVTAMKERTRDFIANELIPDIAVLRDSDPTLFQVRPD